MINDIYSHLLPIEGAYNVRDIGNYETQNGFLTKEGVFFRSDNTAGYTKNDIRFFKNKGLTLAVDLRSADETDRQASPFVQTPGIHYENIQLIDGIHSQFTRDNIPTSMGQLYIHFLESSKPQFGKMFRLFAENNGASLGLDVPDFMLHADPQNMEEALAHMHKTYGSAEKYLQTCNIANNEIHVIKERFLVS